MQKASSKYDLRYAIELLKTHDGQWHETSIAVNPEAELAGVYRHIGAGGTVMRPTKLGPAMLFKNVMGFDDISVLIGLLADRKRVALLLNTQPEALGFLLRDCVNRPIEPIVVSQKGAPCREMVHLASDPHFDIRKLVPAPTNTPVDAGPYITMGMCYASHPDTGIGDITIHRLCLQDKDELSIFFTPGCRHIGAMARRAEELEQPLPISISIGVDPAIEVASCFEPPTTPLGFNELAIAGALRGEAVELTACETISENAIANAEFVIEGEIVPHRRVQEDQNTRTGYAMPEFPGYAGVACTHCHVIKVKAITNRLHPILQTCIGPSEEHVNMVGIPTEASIMDMIERAMPGKLKNVYAHSSGGGKYLAVLQFHKKEKSDEGRQRQAALLAFSAFSELKHIILVDDDVDPFDTNDVLWALNTRYQGDVDTIFLPGVRCHPLDPSANPQYNHALKDNGISCKTIFDCTVPFEQQKRFARASFMDVDWQKYL